MANRDIWDEIELVGKGEHLDEEMFEYLSAYADGECTAKERRLVEAYLAESPEARAQLADLRMQAAITSEGFVDPPEWLRTAILSKTVDKPRLRWPFAAAITAATAGAAALAVYWLAPAAPMGDNTTLIANVVTDQPTVDEPEAFLAPPTMESAPSAAPSARENQPTAVKASRNPRQETGNMVSLSTPASSEKTEKPVATVPIGPKPSAEQEPDPELTYAVVDHGNARFEAKQPDVFASEPPTAEPSRTHTSTSPAVLPDAREKLRDKVRKMNEEKLEIGGDDQ